MGRAEIEGIPQQVAIRMRRAGRWRAWLYLAPGLLMIGLYLVYPLFQTVFLSFHDHTGAQFVGTANYRWLLSDPAVRGAVRNSLLWLLVVPPISTCLGLVAAGLSDRVAWGRLARALIFMPMAISFVGAAVIWRFVYEYRPLPEAQIGLLNALVTAAGLAPQAWISLPFWNNLFLMLVLIWIQTGFAMVFLHAALRALPQDTIEAAILDGARPFQVFWRIEVPQIRGTIAVVWTAITLSVPKVFDIVLSMTNGQWNSDVLANQMFDWMFQGGGDSGRGATIAVALMVLVVPLMIWTALRARRHDGAGR